jgi:hypothetical protein
MRRGTKTETVRVTAKGQKGQPQMNADERRSTGRIGAEGAIRRGFGLLKREPGGKSLADEWAEHKKEESELEEVKHSLWRQRGIQPR